MQHLQRRHRGNRQAPPRHHEQLRAIPQAKALKHSELVRLADAEGMVHCRERAAWLRGLAIAPRGIGGFLAPDEEDGAHDVAAQCRRLSGPQREPMRGVA